MIDLPKKRIPGVKHKGLYNKRRGILITQGYQFCS